MKSQSKAQQLRCLIDDLERSAVDASVAVKDLPALDGKSGELLPKTPDGIKSLIGVLTRAYLKAKAEENAPSTTDLKFLQDIAPAKKAVQEAKAALKEAQTTYNKAMAGHEHRIRIEDPEINNGNGLALYPDHPTCVVCEEEMEYEWYCSKSPELRCQYPNVLGKGSTHFVSGTLLMEANHDGDIECIHCGETWTRMR